MLELVALYDFVLFENLEGVLLVVGLLYNEEHLAVGALTDDGLGNEVLG